MKLDKLASETTGLTGSDISELVYTAANIATRQKKKY